MRAMEFTKEACVARKENLKKRASEDHQKLKSSEVVYQMLTSSEAENWKLKFVKVVILNVMTEEGMEAWSNA